MLVSWCDVHVFTFSKNLYLWPFCFQWQDSHIDGWRTCSCKTFLLQGNTYCCMMFCAMTKYHSALATHVMMWNSCCGIMFLPLLLRWPCTLSMVWTFLSNHDLLILAWNCCLRETLLLWHDVKCSYHAMMYPSWLELHVVTWCSSRSLIFMLWCSARVAPTLIKHTWTS